MQSVSARTLDAAGITDPALRAAYERCRRLASSTGGINRLATRLLPPAKRPHVWAVSGFARRAAGFLDSLGTDGLGTPDAGPAQAWAARTMAALGGAPSDDPMVPAMLHTMRRWQIPRVHVEVFLSSLRADRAVTCAPTMTPPSESTTRPRRSTRAAVSAEGNAGRASANRTKTTMDGMTGS